MNHMKKELTKAYEPQKFEDEIYQKWEQSGFFNPDNLTGEPYSIMMPPPNVTGVLHLGHALENSLMDIMARYQRMQGKKVLLLPGTDHAAVATQAKVEKVLQEQGIKNPRQELGREKLLEEIKTYAEKSKATILSQIRKMGTSCDWSRLAYTFDEKRNRTVNEIFVKMYNDGLIYRGKRIINWDAKLQTTISDDEIVWHDETTPFYYLQYGPFTIATARPETKFGDKYVVMHPNDKRYAKYQHGEQFECEWINGKVTATVIKDDVIDPEFGTGVMTITPYHDMIDFEIAQRHKLEGEQIIDFDGRLMPVAGEFAGMDILEARPKIIEKLEEKGLVAKVEENYAHRVAKGDRSNSLVEPQVKEQWFMNVNKTAPGKEKSLREMVKETVEIGHNGDPDQKIDINPERFEKVFFHWIENLHDWCISRQIWWGHRIPAWYRGAEIYVGANPPEGENWKQDEDTLDTWFSSGMWTFSTLDKPNDLKTFHPTNWMQMGYEILFLWMVRMILMSTYHLDQIPFRNVYIHGMLRSEDGKKFSKSSGNNIDPLEVINQYGTDALRLSLISGITPGNDSKFYVEKVENARNFVNKLWNISRYILSSDQEIKAAPETDSLLPSDIWILEKFTSLIESVSDNLEKYQFSQAAERLMEFTRDDLADWYLEVAKFEDNKEAKAWILKNILQDLLKLWHPFIPFVTETIWSNFSDGKMLLVEKWPSKTNYIASEKNTHNFDLIKDVVIAIRNARSENKIEPSKKIKAVIYAKNWVEFIRSQEVLIRSLRTSIGELEIMNAGEKIDKAIFSAVDDIEIYLLDAIDETKEKGRLGKEIANLEKYITSLEGTLGNAAFVAKAPEAVVAKQRKDLSEAQTKLAEIQKHLQTL